MSQLNDWSFYMQQIMHIEFCDVQASSFSKILKYECYKIHVNSKTSLFSKVLKYECYKIYVNSKTRDLMAHLSTRSILNKI